MKIYQMIFLLFLLGCSTPKESGLTDNLLRPVTNETLKGYAENFQTRVKEFPNDAFTNQWDVRFFLNRIYKAAKLNPNELDIGIDRDLEFSFPRITYALSKEIPGSEYEFIKTRIGKSKAHSLFRSYNYKTNAINYHDFLIVDRGGNVRIGDVYLFSTGEYLSQTYARQLASNPMEDNPFARRYTVDERKFFLSQGDMQLAFENGDANQVNLLLEKGRKSFGGKKFWRIMEADILSWQGNPNIETVLTQLLDDYPKDPSVIHNAFRYYYVMGEGAKTIQKLEALKEYVNDDVILDFVKVRTLVEMAELTKALETLQIVIDKKPNDAELFYWKLMCEGFLKDFESGASTIRTMYSRFGIDLRDIQFSIFETFEEPADFWDWVEKR